MNVSKIHKYDNTKERIGCVRCNAKDAFLYRRKNEERYHCALCMMDNIQTIQAIKEPKGLEFIVINPHYCTRGEHAELIDYLKENQWAFKLIEDPKDWER